MQLEFVYVCCIYIYVHMQYRLKFHFDLLMYTTSSSLHVGLLPIQQGPPWGNPIQLCIQRIPQLHPPSRRPAGCRSSQELRLQAHPNAEPGWGRSRPLSHGHQRQQSQSLLPLTRQGTPSFHPCCAEPLPPPSHQRQCRKGAVYQFISRVCG